MNPIRFQRGVGWAPVLALTTWAAACGGSSRLPAADNHGAGRAGAPGAGGATASGGRRAEGTQAGGEAGDGGEVGGSSAGAGEAGSSAGGRTSIAGADNGGTSAGGDAGDDTGGTTTSHAGSGSDPSRSKASVLFPPAISYTDAWHLAVRGTASDPDGVKGVTVYGIAATSSDGFAHFSATVPVFESVNEFSVEVTDDLGHVTEDAASFTVRNSGTVLVNVVGMDFDPASGDLLVADEFLPGIVRVDLVEHRASILAGIGVGAGDYVPDGRAVVVDGDRALALSWGDDVLLAVDLENGDRSLVSPAGSSDTEIQFTTGLALDAENSRAFALTFQNIVAIDLVTGNRQALAEDVASGITFQDSDDIAYDATTSAPRVLVSDKEARAIIAVDIASGARSILSSDDVGSGTPFQTPSRLKLDPSNHRVLVVDGSIEARAQTSYHGNRAAIVGVDLTTGQRTTLTDAVTGSGPLPERPYGVALDEARGHAYLADDWGGDIADVDLTSHDRESAVDSDVGSGDKFTYPTSVLFRAGDGANGLVVVDGFRGGLVRVNPETGARSELSGPSTGDGPLFGVASAGVLSSDEREAIVLDRRLRSLFGVDLVTGDRRLIASPDVGSGPSLGEEDLFTLEGIGLDAANHRALVTNAYGTPPLGLYAVDLTNGDRALLSDATTGSGPEFVNPGSAIVDGVTSPSAPRVLVAYNSGIVQVNPTTGDRAYLSNGSTGTGPFIYGASALVLNAPARSVYTVGGFDGGLFSVSLDNGDRTLISGRQDPQSSLVGAGPTLVDAEGLAIDAERGVAYVTSPLEEALFVIDLASGDRVLVSH